MSDLPPENATPEQEEAYLPEQQQRVRPLARWRSFTAHSRRRRVRLFLGRSISLQLALLFLVLVVVGAVGAAGLHYSNRPLFCISCHEMSVHYATWRQSTHRNVSCEDCHLMPGTMNMFKGKFAALRQIYLHQKGGVRPSVIQGHVPDVNCKRCHPVTLNLVVYHNLKITHKKHWDRKIECTFCHERVVHGPRVEQLRPEEREQQGGTALEVPTGGGMVGNPVSFIYPPSMATCFECHDGKKASNDCSLCHLSLLAGRPSTFSPEWVVAHKDNVAKQGDTCMSCHQQDFCSNCHITANPHPSNWIEVHPQQFAQKPGTCPVCHRAPNERPTNAAMAFCSTCHNVRREHRGLDWRSLHPKEFRANPDECAKCHSQSWCANCHKISHAHPPDWLRTHPVQANINPTSCKTCHEESFCIACHKGRGPGATPASHQDKEAWLKGHKSAVQAKTADCAVCHTEEFCRTCHRSVKPTSHGPGWLKAHSASAAQQATDCLICHRQNYCTSCHGLQMPHPSDWVARHPRFGLAQRRLCNKCHATDSCNNCHRGQMPASHQPLDTWMSRHDKVARAGKQDCKLCHRTILCDTCHGLKMPHPRDWLPKGHTAAVKADASVCVRCHKQDFCVSCHGTALPHPDNWLEQHPKDPKASLKSDSLCFNCHDRKQDCAMCHGE